MDIPSITQARYRYHEMAPESISVPVAELLKRLPDACCGENDPGDRKVDLPCPELLDGNTPRLPLARLHQLLPDFVRLPEGTDQEMRITLPGGWLSLYFHLVTRREELLPEPETLKALADIATGEIDTPLKALERPVESTQTGTAQGEVEGGEQNPTPKPDSVDPSKSQLADPAGEVAAISSQNGVTDEASSLGASGKKSGGLRGLISGLSMFGRHGAATVSSDSRKPAPEPLPDAMSSSQKKGSDAAHENASSAVTSYIREKKGTEKQTPLKSNALPEGKKSLLKQPLTVDVVTTTVLDERGSLRGAPNRKRVPKSGFFAALPIFRRHTPEEVSSASPAEMPQPAPEQAESSRQELESAIPVLLEPLWKLDPHNPMADSPALQALFMTEEKLTLDRVIVLAGQLPGLRACVLVHGSNVVCASNTPAGFDLQALSAQAMKMLSQIRESSENLGLGAVPAVTLHADQGALSFLHNGELCLLVLHADRGFVPGVRERLQEMLCHLSSAKALPGGPSPQATLPI